uniref:interferon gamma receptor 1 isoform X2 n=1 Tax=Doryrhamphus excisus TaxID=161450 RepID=UPI0025AEB6B3|nr:interferon gamma receptor 1 isoform X2 [Doryrhamphus excisus]
MLPGGAFRALWMLLVAVASAQPVAPPTNVTVTCRNALASVNWDYGGDEAPTSFQVYVGSSDRRHLEDVTAEHKYDNVSALVWDSLESVMDVHYVTLTAARGRRFSANVSKTFTFNHLKMADVTCQLDFPPVHVRADDSGTVVTFPNPLRYYPELRQATRMSAVSLDFSVSPHGSQGDVRGSCQIEQKTCRVDMLFPDGADHCVTLTGAMSDRAGRYVAFQKTEPVCVDESALEPMMLALLLTFLFIIITGLALAIWKLRAWTMKINKDELPKSLRSGRILSKGECNMDADCRVEMVSGVEDVRLISRCGEDSSCESTATESIPIHPEEEEQEVEEVEEEEEGESAYDCTHVEVQVDLGDGATAWGYTER